VVEGEVKADKAGKHAPDALVVGIAGITGWSRGGGQIHELLARLATRRVVYVAPDADHRTNPDVQRGLDSMSAALRRAGAASVRLLEWDREKGKGLDDYLAAATDPDAETRRLLDTANGSKRVGTIETFDLSKNPPPVRGCSTTPSGRELWGYLPGRGASARRGSPPGSPSTAPSGAPTSGAM
jgi:hypothetical protein